MVSLKISSCIIFLLFSLTSLAICQAHSLRFWSEKHSPSPLSFLKKLNGTRKGNQAKGLIELKKYLVNLGYMSTTYLIDDNFFDDSLESAVKKYQRFYRLKITGILDLETLSLMSRRRCGVRDVVKNSNTKLNRAFKGVHNEIQASSHYAIGIEWPRDKRNLTYAYREGTREDIYAPLVLALVKWTNVSPFRFHYSENFASADIKISFERGDHGDGTPFDGPNGILAHAFPPPDGRLHFDADETWSPDPGTQALDMEIVALHELGHVLGLGHSTDENAVMYAYMSTERKELTPDDIQGIHTLYPNN